MIYSPSSLQERISISKGSPEVQAVEQPLSRPGAGRSEEIKCCSSQVIRQPQITAQEGMSGPEHTRDFVLAVVLEFL